MLSIKKFIARLQGATNSYSAVRGSGNALSSTAHTHCSAAW